MTASPEGEDLVDLDVGRVWREERVSCPHIDILRAFLAQSLQEGAMDFVRFHLERSQCPYCNAVLAELQAHERANEREVFTDLRDRLLRSTRTALRRPGQG